MADINLTSLPTTTATISGRVVGFETSGYRVYNLNEYARLASNLNFSGTTTTFEGDVDAAGDLTNDGDTVLTSTNSATVSGDNLSAQRDVFLQRYAPSFTTSRDLVAQDFYKKIECTNSASPNLRINPNITNLKGVTIKIDRLGSGEVSVTAQPGVTLLSLDNSTFLAGQYATATLEYKGRNTWLLTGDLA